MNITAASRFSLCALAAALFLGTPLSASAGFVRVNFGPAFDIGQDWTGSFDDDIDSNGVDLAGGAVFKSALSPSGAPFSLGASGGPSFAGSANEDPFADGLRIGDTFYNSFCFSKNGVIGLGTSTSNCSLDAGSSPLFSVLGDVWNYVPSGSAPAPSSVSASLGLVDRDFFVDDTYDLATAVPTLRILWNGVADDDFEFQAFFYDLNNGNFDVEFFYSGPHSGNQFVSVPGAVTPLFLGEGAARLNGVDGEPYFRFLDGEFSLSSTTPPTSVPEPGPLWLLSTGAILLLVRRRTVARPAR